MAVSIVALRQELAATFRENADAQIRYDENTSEIRMRLRELEVERERLQISLEALHQARLSQEQGHSEKIERIEREIVVARVERPIPTTRSVQTDVHEPAAVHAGGENPATVEDVDDGKFNVEVEGTAQLPVEIEDDDAADVDVVEVDADDVDIVEVDADDVDTPNVQEHTSDQEGEQQHVSTTPSAQQNFPPTQTVFPGSRVIHCIFRTVTIGGCTRTFWTPAEASSHYSKHHCVEILKAQPRVVCPRCPTQSYKTAKSAQNHLRKHITEDLLMIRELDEEVLGDDDELSGSAFA